MLKTGKSFETDILAFLPKKTWDNICQNATNSLFVHDIWKITFSVKKTIRIKTTDKFTHLSHI